MNKYQEKVSKDVTQMNLDEIEKLIKLTEDNKELFWLIKKFGNKNYFLGRKSVEENKEIKFPYD